MRADVETLQAQVVHQIPPRIQGLESRGLGLELRVQSPEYDGKGNSFGLLEVNFSVFIFFSPSFFLSLSLSIVFPFLSSDIFVPSFFLLFFLLS